MHEMIKRLRYIFHVHEPISLISIFLSFILFSTTYLGLLRPVNAGMKKTFNPRISIYEQHDNNIDMISNLDYARRDPNGKIVEFEKNSDWITMISPGFSLNLDSPKTKIELDYETRLSLYHREKNQERDNDLHYGTVHWEQQLSRNIKLETRDTFSRSDDPLVSEEGLLEEVVVGRRIYYHNNGQISLSMRFGVDSSSVLGYRNLYLNNKSANYEDSISHEFFFNLDTKLNPFWGIGLESRINRGIFKQPEGFTGSVTEDFYDYEGVITLNYHWHPSRRLFAKYSLLAKKYDNPDITEFWLHQSSVGLSLILSPHTNFSVDGGYFLQDFPGGRKSEDGARFNIVLNTKKKKSTVRIGGSGGFTQDYFSSENLGSSKFKQVFVSASYLLIKDLSAFLSANYQWENFLEEKQDKRKDEVWRASGGFRVLFSDWLTLSIEETYSERKSESDLVFNRHPEFIRDNRVILHLTAAYPIIF